MLCKSVSIVTCFSSVGVSSSDTVLVISLLGFIFSIVFSALPITVSSSFVIVLTSIVPLSDIVIGLTNSKSKLIYLDLPKDDPTKRKPVIDLAKDKLNWQPTIPLEEGLKRTIDYFKKNL